jgi:hypothetical protein
MAATHYGNCQICGREHKVSGQSIAKHGYTLAHGWQEGACYGSGGKPIQLSCDLIEGGIAAAQRFIDSARLQIAEPIDAEGFQKRVTKTTTRAGDVRFNVITVRVVVGESGKVEVQDYRGKAERTFYRANTTVAEVQADIAETFAKYLSARIAQTEENIAFMQKIVADWKPSELRPIPAHELEENKVVPVHFAAFKYGVKNAPMCVGSASGAMRSRAAVTTDHEKVNCPRCLKAIAERAERDARKAAERAAQKAGE